VAQVRTREGKKGRDSAVGVLLPSFLPPSLLLMNSPTLPSLPPTFASSNQELLGVRYVPLVRHNPYT